MNQADYAKFGLTPTFFIFINFVKNEIAPYMQMEFVVEDYIKELYEEFRAHQYTAQQIHRGAGKTEFGIWITIFYAVCQPENPFSGKRIQEQLIITQAGEAIDSLCSRIKHYFYENPRLAKFIPDGVSIKNRKNDFWNSKEMYLKNGHIIHFRPINSRSIRGLHPDRIWADDLVGDNSAVVDKDIEEKWFYAVHGCTTAKNALVDVTGTPRRFTDIMFKMKENKSYFFKARPILGPNGEILSSKRWNQEKIDQVKSVIGSVIFQCEYMLNPLDDSTGLIRSEWITRNYDRTRGFLNERPTWAKAVYLGVDFAFSDRLTADKSAFIIIAEGELEDRLTKQMRKLYVIINIIEKRGMSGLEQFEFMKQLHSTYRFEMIGVEENSIKAISKSINSFNLPLKRYWTGTTDEKTEKGIIKDYETIGKRNLILRIGNQLEQNNVIIPYDETSKPMTNELYNELITFAQEDGKVVEIGKHSDFGMALGIALEVGTRWGGSFFLT
jgi:hypothetical protein